MKGLDSFAIKASENMKITKLVFFSKYVTFTSLATDVVWIDPEIFFRHSFCLMNSSKMATFIYCQLLMESLINVRRYYDAYAIKETKGQPNLLRFLEMQRYHQSNKRKVYVF